MSNVYSTTLGLGYAITGACVTLTAAHTIEPVLGPGHRNRKNVKLQKKMTSLEKKELKY